MEGKLIKLEESKYTLVYKEGNIAWENNPAFDGKLSLKNCQAIENGYDLDELADTFYMKFENQIENPALFYRYFKLIFPEALSILGDKKFSEEDVTFMFQFGFNLDNPMSRNEYDAHIQSLQQTEWDVEIEMWFHGTRHKKGEWIPKLDEDGCLILKKK